MIRKKTTRRKKPAPGSIGLAPLQTKGKEAAELSALARKVEEDGGAVLGSYQEPYGSKSLLHVALPIGAVRPTPYQRDVSEKHVKRLMAVIEKSGATWTRSSSYVTATATGRRTAVTGWRR